MIYAHGRRRCGTTVSSFKHAVSLFSSMAVKQQLPSRIENLLKVAGNDGLPQHICEKCKRRVETLERATEDLGKFRSQASEVYIGSNLALRDVIVPRTCYQTPWNVGAITLMRKQAFVSPPPGRPGYEATGCQCYHLE